MPMMPGPIAAITYTAVKVVGYAGFAHVLNKLMGRSVSPYKFGAVKTALGLVGGLFYIFAMIPILGISDSSTAIVFAGAAPIRALAWAVAFAIFYGFKERPQLMLAAIVAGVVWSYLLDGAMSVLYQYLPGMQMPFC